MKRYIVLGVNENPKYLYYLPLVMWAWGEIGWWPIIFYSGQDTKVSDFAFDEREGFCYHLPANGYKSETLSQVSRLYGACCVEEDSYLMTSDMDMLPLKKNIFHYEGHRVLAIGRDLTDYHYPICYIGARNYIWRRFMKLDDINFNSTGFSYALNRDLRHQKNMWGLDQDIVTEKLLAYGIENINHINRGTDNRTGYPIGRVDRSNWRLDHKQLIDCHLPHDILTNDKSFHNVLNLLHLVWPKEDWTWFINYHKEFKKLL